MKRNLKYGELGCIMRLIMIKIKQEEKYKMNESQFYAHISEDGTRKQTIESHLLGTAEKAAKFAAEIGEENRGYLAGLIHDVGKYSKAFQKRLEGGAKVDHSSAGAQLAFKHLREALVAMVISGHHGGIPDFGSRNDVAGDGTFIGRMKKEVEDYTAWESEEVFQLWQQREQPSSQHLNGVDLPFRLRMLYSCLVDADYLDTEEFMKGQVDRGQHETVGELHKKLETYIAPWWDAKTELNKKRCEILRQCIDAGKERDRGLYTLTVPTGGGKTVSSLAFALNHAKQHEMKRVIYVIPYTSIIDQTAQVFQGILGPENVVEHHSGLNDWLGEDEPTPEQARKILATENWDAPIIVTTAVQFFESLFSNKPSRCRKLHNIANSVVIFDEAQTLPMDYLRPCVMAISELVKNHGVTAVLCTATQPALQPLFEKEYGVRSEEICHNPDDLYNFFKRTTFVQAKEDWSEEYLAEQLNQVPQALCVVNRRATAQRVYELLEEEGSYCLTTLLCPADRKRLLEEIRTRLKNKQSCRVVSTSLIEAGVDLDFPAVWREHAGLDSVLQAAGRCNREGKRTADQSVVTVFTLEGQVIPKSMEQNAQAAEAVWWGSDSEIDSLGSISMYFKRLMSQKNAGESEWETKFMKQVKEFAYKKVAEDFHLIEDNQYTIYLPVEEMEEQIAKLKKGEVSRTLYRQLAQFAVSIPVSDCRKLEELHLLYPVGERAYVLEDMRYYNPQKGLELNKQLDTAIIL